ncbi:MAG: PQQ-like beta-propeller repeat protein [Actinomycetales bacterium]|nr:PQQ-like beta-propeller repeat protein [Actinomycetales bacterium]
MRPDGLVEVALVEGDDAPGPRAGRRRRSPARRRRVAAAVAAAALAAVVLVDAHAAATVAARTRDAVALSTSLAVPPAVVWQVAAGTVAGTVDDVVVLTDPDGTHVTAVGLDDGATRWSHPIPVDQGGCSVHSGVVVCLGTTPGDATTSSVVSLDPRSGAELHSLLWPGAYALTTRVGDDLVLVGSDDAGRMVAARWSPTSGATVWAYRSAADVVGPVPTAWELGTGWARVSSRSRAAVSLATGRAVPVDAPGQGPLEDPTTVRTGAGVLVQTTAPAGSDLVLAVSRGVEHEVTGTLVPVPAGDRTARGLALVGSDGTLARVDDSGRAHWRLLTATWASVAPYPVLAVDGVLAVSQGDTLLTIDALDGRTLWSAPTGVPAAASAVSDGTLLAHVERSAAGLALVARLPRTGTVVWRDPLPDASVARLALAPDGTVLVTTGSDLLALRPPG